MQGTADGADGGALAGLRVVEVANFISGPYAAMLLADLGADVVKVEPPPDGDPFRAWDGDDYSPTFQASNRNKRSLQVDLRTEDGAAICRRLLAAADVFVENLRPGALDRLGLSYEALAALNPRLIYCSISGFGGNGPYAARPGYDTIGQALSGLLGAMTDLAAPRPMGVSVADHLTGIYACYGILAALLARVRTGRGQRVETSLLQSALAFQGENAARFLAFGESPTQASRARIAQIYAFVAGDGKPFVVHLSSPAKFWEGLTDAIGRADLRADPRFATRDARRAAYDDLHGLLAGVFRTGPRDHWLAALERHDVPSAPINTLAEAFADPQVEHLDLVARAHHPQRGDVALVANAVRLADTPARTHRPPPLPGEHTADILAELGYSLEDIAIFHQAGVL